MTARRGGPSAGPPQAGPLPPRGARPRTRGPGGQHDSERVPLGRRLAALQAPPAGLLEPVAAGCTGAGGADRAVLLQGRHQRHRLPGPPGGAQPEAPAGHRRPRPRPACPRAVRRAHLAGGGHGGDVDGHHRGGVHRRAGRHFARLGRRRADVADRPVPEPAATAAAAVADLPVPRAFEAGVWIGGGHLHPHRRRHRRLSLDAGGAPGAGAVLQPAREGIRRGRPRPGRQHAARRRAPHPAQQPGPGDRGGHHRRGRGHHCREHAQLSRPRVPARHSHLGPHPLRRARLHGHRRALGDVPGDGHLHHGTHHQFHR